MLIGCGPSEPVPTHGPLDAVREAVVSADQRRLVAATATYTVSQNRLSSLDAMRWGTTRKAATRLARSTVPSKRHEFYAVLVQSCRACHQDDKASRDPVVTHGEAFAALDEGLAFVDPRRLEMSAEALGDVANLTNIQSHVMERARAASIATSDLERVKAVRDVYDTCVRCHGKVFPVPRSAASSEQRKKQAAPP